jgi:NADH:ubiquinone oxidoreductase subunit 6 (subunit J)
VHHADRNVEWRYDAQGRPYLPADNSSYLGRSLFTDFLLPVELGGVLLLVATIGAIAIAHRRATTARAS